MNVSLLLAYRSLNVADDVTGVTPLQVAVETGNIDCIREMILCGAQVDAVDRTGRTVFHYAARSSNEMIIQVIGFLVMQFKLYF